MRARPARRRRLHRPDHNRAGRDERLGSDLDPVEDDRAHSEHRAVPDARVAADIRAGVEHHAYAEARVVADERAAGHDRLPPELGGSADHGARPDEAPLAELRGRAHVGRGMDNRGRPPAVLREARPEREPVAAEPEHHRPRLRVESHDGKAVHLAADPA